MKVIRRFPNFSSGFEEDKTEHTVNSIDELMVLPWIKDWLQSKSFHKICYSGDKQPYYLMIVQNYQEKYSGCTRWWVIGYIENGDPASIGLEDYIQFTGAHLDDCPKKSYQHNSCTCGFN